ncbi:hypothetical protein FOPG_19249 [Fusarium oxysporum f. sp. conglutinans race 2 54008]|uniref:Uncharacterized protein n=1 Tax=Fusarium oxysporum f. sp. conglutinans race 2 54008 TaxID=1089457 RepID=X0GLK4_FUSOX|nr:hypothetical protein FOPG_19249 [Fusarium oxysporum f. sp. conglutinans race 2 54008]
MSFSPMLLGTTCWKRPRRLSCVFRFDMRRRSLLIFEISRSLSFSLYKAIRPRASSSQTLVMAPSEAISSSPFPLPPPTTLTSTA